MEAFCREDDREKVQYATAAVFSNVRKTRDLIFTNAGRPFALWHEATEDTWDWLDNKTPYLQTTGGSHPAWNRSRVNRYATENMSLLRPSSIPRTWAAEHVCRVSGRLRQQEAVRRCLL
jgi:hypothetical protein